MKQLSILSLAFLLVFASCKKDPELIIEPDTTTFKLALYPKIGNEDLVLRQEYLDGGNYRIKPTLLKCYISHLTLLTSSGSELEIKDLALLDMDKIASGEPFTIEAAIPAGSYTGIKFWIGLDSTQNASDPATFAQDHPLSTYQGTFWTWNTGYRFVMFEGYYDTVPNTTGPLANTLSFNYHTGTNPLYREAVLGSANVPFSVEEGGTHTYSLDLDFNSVFYGAQDIDRKQGAVTHTTGNYSLAEKFTENLVRSFKLSTP